MKGGWSRDKLVECYVIVKFSASVRHFLQDANQQLDLHCYMELPN